MQNHEEQLMTTKEAAMFLQVVPETLRKWMRKGIISPSVRIGNSIRFTKADLIPQKGKDQHLSPSKSNEHGK